MNKNNLIYTVKVSVLGAMLTGLVWWSGCMTRPKNPSPIPATSRIHAPAPIAGVQFTPPTPPSSPGLNLPAPGGRPSLDEEIWVIARGTTPSTRENQDSPGTGAMLVSEPHAEKEIPLPLKHTHVQARLEAYIATVEVTQQFHNPFREKIEAKYVFPLPHNAAINEFIMTIGTRHIRGILRERAEAEKIYQEARSQGYVASLLIQERPNVFTQSVANIEPGKSIDVQIKYFHTLAYTDGWYEFVFPMVVGPRFNPPGFTEGIGAVARGASGRSGQSAEVHYLKPGERSGHDISLTVEVQAAVAIEEWQCRSHVVTAESKTAEQLAVTLSPTDAIPNQDFVLRYRVAGARVKSQFLASRDHRGGFFTLMVYPPQSNHSLSRKPLEMVFVLDRSGSMSGRPLDQAKLAVQRALRQLQAEDSFQIIEFSDRASTFGTQPVPATSEQIRKGLSYLDKLRAGGGTMMINGIRAALEFPHDPSRLRFVVFLTDGYIGNEVEILAEIERRLGASRIFSFGIGNGVNRYLIEQMAKVGRGAVAYLGAHESAAVIMDDFIKRISQPVLTDVRIDWGGLQVADVYPQRLPDLFVGRPLILTGRFQNAGPAQVRVQGGANGHTVEIPVSVTARDFSVSHSALGPVWARLKIADLADRMLAGSQAEELAGQIKYTALDFGLMSAYTAFVAVDASERTVGDHGTTVPVALPMPEGVRYDTTVQE